MAEQQRDRQAAGEVVPRLDWRRRRTWAVFLGLGWLAGALAFFTQLLVERLAGTLIGQEFLRAYAPALCLMALVWLLYRGLARSCPWRDHDGRPLPGSFESNTHALPHILDLLFVWALWLIPWFFLLVNVWDSLPSRPFPWSSFGPSFVVLPLFGVLAVELTYRLLWRAPAEAAAPP